MESVIYNGKSLGTAILALASKNLALIFLIALLAILVVYAVLKLISIAYNKSEQENEVELAFEESCYKATKDEEDWKEQERKNNRFKNTKEGSVLGHDPIAMINPHNKF